MAKVRRMFFGGNTSRGFYSLHKNIIAEDRRKLYILKGMPGGGKSTLMKGIGQHMLDKGFALEYHHCPSDPDSVDSVLIDQLGVGIVDGAPPHSMDPTYPGLIDRLIDLNQFIDEDEIAKHRDELIQATINKREAYQKAYTYFKSARLIYDEIIENNSKDMDFNGVNRETLSLIGEIFAEKLPARGGSGFRKRYIFSNANTPDGFVDFMETILEGVSKIYYIGGDIGRGKSTLMGRIVEEANIRGYAMEIYMNSTMPDKMESLLIKDLDLCITSNRKGLYFPHEKLDLDAYYQGERGNDKDYHMYKLLIEEATLELCNARENHGILERCYIPRVDYTGVDRAREAILEEILGYIE